MKNVFNLVVLGVTFTAWLTYNFPPLVEAESKTARRVRAICGFIIGAGIGWAFGSALSGVLV